MAKPRSAAGRTRGDRPWTAADARAGPVVEAPAMSGWAGNRTRTYVVLDLRELAGRGAGLPPDNWPTTLIGLETGPAETLPGRLRAAFERYQGHSLFAAPSEKSAVAARIPTPSLGKPPAVIPARTTSTPRFRLCGERRMALERYGGEEEGGLREGYHARVRYSRSPHGGEGLPSFPEFERALERKRGGAEMPTLMDARAMEWEARVMERGREQGIVQGRAEGRRDLLCRQAERRFGPETAARLAEHMAEAGGVEELLQVGDWILDCTTGRELLDRCRHPRDT